ncbi:MAG: formylmethanofuran dehydrogenase subunit C [Candidatus Asgardarchaeia archaeon]
MSVIVLQLKYDIATFIHAENITPEKILGRDILEIKEIPLFIGSTETTIGDLFNVKSEKQSDSIHASENKIILEGNFENFKRIGYKMKQGIIEIRGNSGMYTGEKMLGGRIEIFGNTDSWLGLGMKGGTIEVHGNAQDFVGGSYRGELKGMSGGTIIIHGSAGNEVGYALTGGKIIIKGDIGDFAGVHMKDGIIAVDGGCGKRCGPFMKGGHIVIMGKCEEILPSFKKIESVKKIEFDDLTFNGLFDVYEGDKTENGMGRLYVRNNIG